MRFIDRYPIIVTPRIEACRDFYVRYLGFAAAFEASWIVYLVGEEGSASIAFMTPDHPSAPPGPEVFSGKGMCLEFQVEDAAKAFRDITAKGLQPSYPLRDEPFGQRRFGFHDPAGTWIDIVEQTGPAPGYWERYRKEALS